MYNSLYMTTTEPHCGKSVASLGVVRRLLRRTRRLAVFRPIINTGPGEERDKNIDLLLSYFKLEVPYEDTYAFHANEALELLAQNEEDKFLNRVIQKFKNLEDNYDFVLCIGSDLSAEGTAFECDRGAVDRRDHPRQIGGGLCLRLRRLRGGRTAGAERQHAYPEPSV